MDGLVIVDISTLPRGKPIKTPLCKNRKRAWNPKVRSVGRSTKTLDTTADDDAAPDTDSHIPPVARAPPQSMPQSIAPSFSQLEIVDISTLPRGKPIETPLCKNRKRAWNPKVRSVARSTKTLDTTADDDAAPDTVSHIPPVARAPPQSMPQSIAPSFSQLQIVDISTLPRGKPIETPLCKNRKRAWNPKVRSVARSTKTLDTPADDDAAPDTDSHIPPVARAPPQNIPQSIAPSFSQLEIVDISTLPRGKPIEIPLCKNRKRAWNPKMQSVARFPKTLDTPADFVVAPDTDSYVPPVERAPCQNTPQWIAPSFSQLEIVDISTLLRGNPLETPLNNNRKRKSLKVQSVAMSPKTPDPPVDDDAASDTNSSLPPEASSSPAKKTPPSIAPNTCKKVKSVGRSTKIMFPPVVGDAAPATNSYLPRASSYFRRNRTIHKLEIVDISTLLRGKPLETPRSENRKRKSLKVQSVARSPNTPDPPVNDDATPDTNSSLPPEANSSPAKITPPSIAPNTCTLEIVDMSTPPIVIKQLETPLYMKKRGWIMKVRRTTKRKVTPVGNEATPATNSCLTSTDSYSRRIRNRPIPK